MAIAFLASIEVIEQAARLGANLLITHEPIFYNHLDETDWLGANPVYAAKRRQADDAGPVIWRFHRYLSGRPASSPATRYTWAWARG